MKVRFILLSALAATSLYAIAAESIEKLSEPWVLAGASPKSYEIGIDHTQSISGKGSKFLRFVKGDGDSWSTLMQSITADQYRGKRLRFQARVKTTDVSGWAGLWLRIDTKQLGMGEGGFYNSQDKPIKGTTEWQSHSVVLDVPEDAVGIAFGVLEFGKGQVWIDDLKFEVVGKDVAVDVMKAQKKLSAAPSL